MDTEARVCERCGGPMDGRTARARFCSRDCQVAALDRDQRGQVGMFVRLPPDLHERLRQAAADRDLSAAFLARHAIADFLDRLIPVEELRLTRDR